MTDVSPVVYIFHRLKTSDLEDFKNSHLVLENGIYTVGLFAFLQPDPAIFMTDDSTPEKAALRAVFPRALQLLCHFHMLQAEWRWLMSASSGVAKTDRQELMKLFRNVCFRNVCFNCEINEISNFLKV
jgi:hypothetical protein